MHLWKDYNLLITMSFSFILVIGIHAQCIYIKLFMSESKADCWIRGFSKKSFCSSNLWCMNHIQYPIKYHPLMGLIYMLMLSLFSVISWPFHLFSTLYFLQFILFKKKICKSLKRTAYSDGRKITFCTTCV